MLNNYDQMPGPTFQPNSSLKFCHLLLPLPSPALRLYQPSAGIIHTRPLSSTLRDQCQSLMYSRRERRNLGICIFYFPVIRAEVAQERVFGFHQKRNNLHTRTILSFTHRHTRSPLQSVSSHLPLQSKEFRN